MQSRIGNPSLTPLSCHTMTIKERIFHYKLWGDRKFDFVNPKFSESPVPVNFFAVFDDFTPTPEMTEYELIFGNDLGAGAITFPNPGLILPYRQVADNDKYSDQTVVTNTNPEVDRLLLNLLYSPTVPPDCQTEFNDDEYWLQVAARIRPYNGFFMKELSTRAVRSSHSDITFLKYVIGMFSEQLLDCRLPRSFRHGVYSFLTETPGAICSRYGIETRGP